MNFPAHSKLSGNIDTLCYRYEKVFGYGWIFHEKDKINKIYFNKIDENGNEDSINILYGKNRKDVELNFPKQTNSIGCGFQIIGILSSPISGSDNIQIICELDTAEIIKIPVNKTILNNLNDKQKIEKKNINFKRIYYIIRLVINLLSKKRVRYLISLIKESILKNNSNIISNKVKIDLYKNRMILLIDHSMGGGANVYSRQLVEDLSSQKGVITLTFDVVNLLYKAKISYRDSSYMLSFYREDDLFAHLKKFVYDEIIYNNTVSFPNPIKIIDFIISIKSQNIFLKIMIHDYFLICPSQHLINSKGIYCGVPDISECKKCIVQNDYVFFNNYKNYDIDAWRSKSKYLIDCADSITFFSNSSVDIIKKAFPELALKNYLVLPHNMDYFQYNDKADRKITSNLTIGIIGTISFVKGSELVHAVAKEIKYRKLNIKICVIGIIDGTIDNDIVEVTGPYCNNELPSLISSNNIDLIFFPSICPETFSYVIHEIIKMGLPIACLDIGAQAEYVSTYDRGLIIPLVSDVNTILNYLLSFDNSYNTLI